MFLLNENCHVKRGVRDNVTKGHFTKILRVQIPKAQKMTNNLTVFLALSGSAHVKAAHKMLMNLITGVFDKCTSQSINHAIIVVGYGTDAASGKKYWLVRNSWGTGWGAGGYIKLFRGNNQCGIGNFCYAAKCAKTNGTISDPPVVPPPPPIPASQTCDLTKYWPTLTGSYVLTFNGKTFTFLFCHLILLSALFFACYQL